MDCNFVNCPKEEAIWRNGNDGTDFVFVPFRDALQLFKRFLGTGGWRRILFIFIFLLGYGVFKWRLLVLGVCHRFEVIGFLVCNLWVRKLLSFFLFVIMIGSCQMGWMFWMLKLKIFKSQVKSCCLLGSWISFLFRKCFFLVRMHLYFENVANSFPFFSHFWQTAALSCLNVPCFHTFVWLFLLLVGKEACRNWIHSLLFFLLNIKLEIFSKTSFARENNLYPLACWTAISSFWIYGYLPFSWGFWFI